MPYRVCRTFEVENGHMLSKHPDKCRFPHGHTRKVECVLEADDLDDREMVCDFKVLKLVLSDWLQRYDHAICMNTEDPAYADFKARYGDRVIGHESEDPTTEVLARDIFLHLRNALADYRNGEVTGFPLREQVRLLSVKVWETSSSWAEYRA
ncbi:MAG: 6-carboxytetrahydropterin synthase [Verrucomicrobiae bacterium]|nr:6-carboxytetrahydropterin synthase [Verrucomicrobiae bacterium]